jgi:flagellin
MTSTRCSACRAGKRINSAADDAASLAVTNSMTSQINGMQQGVSPTPTVSPLAQTAGGALNEVTNMLQRVRQLAVQSSSGTYQNSDRTSMQSEVTNLNQQISDILSNTKFNGNAVFNVAAGTASTTGADDKSFTIQTGANATDTVDIVSRRSAVPTSSAAPTRPTTRRRRRRRSTCRARPMRPRRSPMSTSALAEVNATRRRWVRVRTV